MACNSDAYASETASWPLEVDVDVHKLENIILYSISDVSNDYYYPASRQGCDCYLFLEVYSLPLVKYLVALMLPLEQC